MDHGGIGCGPISRGVDGPRTHCASGVTAASILNPWMRREACGSVAIANELQRRTTRL
jgi:hypothetical protein